MLSTLDELDKLLRSRVPLVRIETLEEVRITGLLGYLAEERRYDLYTWSVADGLGKYPGGPGRPHSATLQEALRLVLHRLDRGIFVMLDAGPHLADPIVQRLIKEIAQHDSGARTVVFLGPRLELPEDLARLAALFVPALPDADRIRDLYLEEAWRWLAEQPGRRLAREEGVERQLLAELAGLNEEDVVKLVRHAIRADGRLSHEDVDAVVRFKLQALGKGGLIEFFPSHTMLADVGGLDRLKAWLDVRRTAFAGAVARGTSDLPKGVLLLGVQGAGKSLAAKAIASAWQLPLMRLDFASLYNKFIGESEHNLREALREAEAMAPCVLWIDEIEKGLATDGGAADGGVSARLLGTVLTWMSERTARVFLVATANDVSRLPPELMRKGRFDEIFFIDLPNAIEREAILRIHLSRRHLNERLFDMRALVEACAGFSGAEIEQAIVAGLYAAHAAGQTLDTALLLREFSQTRPLSVVMRERMDALRAWARGRTVPASS
jgi:hypothetical protein